MQICKHENCTGCGVCAFVCPRDCITMSTDKIGMIYPVVDTSKCVNCKLCEKTCPQVTRVPASKPINAYAAWSTDNEERRTSASGGIAAELYKNAIENDELCIGASMQKDLSVELELAETQDEIFKFKNSKYVFSSAYKIFPQIINKLRENKKITIIALPCQIAAIKNLVKDQDNLTFIDLVCHGTTPAAYLQEHVALIESKYQKKAQQISFRDPNMGTENFYLSLYDENNEPFYSKRTMHGDTYQFGYHRGISYRENCYNCIYANSERVSDLTLSDYKGLGKLAPCEFGETKVSSILVNTTKGQKIVDELIDKQRISAHQRPIAEPINGDPQLSRPSKKIYARTSFEKRISKNNATFEKAIVPVMREYSIREKARKLFYALLRVKNKFIKH